MNRKYLVCLWCITVLLLIGAGKFQGDSVKAAAADSSPILLTNLQKDASQWKFYQDRGVVSGTLSNIASPTLDGQTLDIGLLGGNAYAGLHMYHNMAQQNESASQFTLALSFFFPSLAHIQALEFTMNTWINGLRWEWAVQWEHYGDGSPEQGLPPNWRIWTGTNWQNIGLQQALAPDNWHSLRLDGNIVAGMVHYTFLQSDDLLTPLYQTFAPVANPGNKLAVGVQLDGDSQERPYHVYLDKVGLFII